MGCGLEDVHHLQQAVGLLAQAGGGCTGLLHQGGILLGDLVQLSHGLTDLLYAAALLGRGVEDVSDQRGHLAHLGVDALHALPGLSDQVGAMPHSAGADELGNFFSGTRTALGQAAYFGRHNGKAPALLPRPAASTAAFSARMLVWNAMLSITPVMSEIRSLLV